MGGGGSSQVRLRQSPSAILGRSLSMGSDLKPPIQTMREWPQGRNGEGVWKKRGAGNTMTQGRARTSRQWSRWGCTDYWERGRLAPIVETEDRRPEYSAPHLWGQLGSARKVSFYIYSGCLPCKEAHIDASFGPHPVKPTPAKGKKRTVSTENSSKGLSSSLPKKPQRPSREDTWGCHLWNLPGSYTLIIVLLKTAIKHIWNASQKLVTQKNKTKTKQKLVQWAHTEQ